MGRAKIEPEILIPKPTNEKFGSVGTLEFQVNFFLVYRACLSFLHFFDFLLTSGFVWFDWSQKGKHQDKTGSFPMLWHWYWHLSTVFVLRSLSGESLVFCSTSLGSLAGKPNFSFVGLKFDQNRTGNPYFGRPPVTPWGGTLLYFFPAHTCKFLFYF